ncbi:MAG: hypothetical protein M1812_002587 [Candelaria pacifica]|nr:MAG: hypothetical protein M1812_002587 [Candelaria pacifica]
MDYTLMSPTLVCAPPEQYRATINAKFEPTSEDIISGLGLPQTSERSGRQTRSNILAATSTTFPNNQTIRTRDQAEHIDDSNVDMALLGNEQLRLMELQSAGTLLAKSYTTNLERNPKVHSCSASSSGLSCSDHRTSTGSTSASGSASGFEPAIVANQDDPGADPKKTISSSNRFLRLPAELRIEVYKLLLVSPQDIKNPAQYLQRSIGIARSPKYFPHLHAAILRTCWTIYDEASPILYSSNHFYFTGPFEVSLFGDEGMDRIGHLARASRLELIQSATLSFSGMFSYSMKSRIYTLDRYTQLYVECFPLLQNPLFPSMRHLSLDFTEWELIPNEYFPELMTEALGRHLKCNETLTIRGIQYDNKTIPSLKKAIVQKGGKLILDLNETRHSPPAAEIPGKLFETYKDQITCLHDVRVLGFGVEPETPRLLGKVLIEEEERREQDKMSGSACVEEMQKIRNPHRLIY